MTTESQRPGQPGHQAPETSPLPSLSTELREAIEDAIFDAAINVATIDVVPGTNPDRDLDD